jgi:hypothetical protein
MPIVIVVLVCIFLYIFTPSFLTKLRLDDDTLTREHGGATRILYVLTSFLLEKNLVWTRSPWKIIKKKTNKQIIINIVNHLRIVLIYINHAKGRKQFRIEKISLEHTIV